MSGLEKIVLGLLLGCPILIVMLATLTFGEMLLIGFVIGLAYLCTLGVQAFCTFFTKVSQVGTIIDALDERVKRKN
jgi:hypothetical protein